MSFTTQQYRHDPSYCDGRYVELKDAGDNVLGRLTYVHLADQSGVGDTWQSNVEAWTIRYVGRVQWKQEVDPNCDYTGEHLHQGQRWPSSQITHNESLPGLIDPTNPTPPGYNWMFRVLFAAPEDWDGDGCTNEQELGPHPNLGGQRDPHNYYDFFDVPAPPIDTVGPAASKNRIVFGEDLNAILWYGGATDNQGPNANGADYDDDLNFNGTEDGLEYDLEGGGPAPGGGPNGVVFGEELAQVMLQGGDSCADGPPD